MVNVSPVISTGRSLNSKSVVCLVSIPLITLISTCFIVFSFYQILFSVFLLHVFAVFILIVCTLCLDLYNMLQLFLKTVIPIHLIKLFILLLLLIHFYSKIIDWLGFNLQRLVLFTCRDTDLF